jgi:hypothetical protein
MALATLGALWLSWISLPVSLIPSVMSLAAFVAAFIDSASSVITPLSVNALNASHVEIDASRIAFAVFLTALAVSSAWPFDWEHYIGFNEVVVPEICVLLIGVIIPQIYLNTLVLARS